MAPTILVTQCAVSWFLLGLAWTTQLIIYPSLSEIKREYSTRINWLLGPAMMLDLTTALMLLFYFTDAPKTQFIFSLNIIFILTIWISMAFLQLPQLKTLEHGFNSTSHAKLMKAHWIPITLWTLKALLLTMLLIATGVTPQH